MEQQGQACPFSFFLSFSLRYRLNFQDSSEKKKLQVAVAPWTAWVFFLRSCHGIQSSMVALRMQSWQMESVEFGTTAQFDSAILYALSASQNGTSTVNFGSRNKACLLYVYNIIFPKGQVRKNAPLCSLTQISCGRKYHSGACFGLQRAPFGKQSSPNKFLLSFSIAHCPGGRKWMIPLCSLVCETNCGLWFKAIVVILSLLFVIE